MDNHIEETITKLKEGSIILCPTDTIWGLGCDVFNESAVARIYEIKNRDLSKPFIILVSDMDMLKKYVPHIHPRIETLLFYHRRPLTIIYKNPINLPDYVLSQQKTIAIRLVKESFIRDIIKLFGKPIISTSANLQGEETPDDYSAISSAIIKKVDFIVPVSYENRIKKSPSIIVSYDEKGEIDLVR